MPSVRRGGTRRGCVPGRVSGRRHAPTCARRPADRDDRGVARARGQETVRDMVLSLAVVMAGVLVFFIFVMPRGHGQPVRVISDASTSVQSFARQAPYPVLAPTGLGQDLW